MTHRFGIRVSLSVMAVSLFIWAAGASISSASADKEKMKPEELVAKHLESIGTADARASAGGRVINGTAVATFRVGGHGQTQGKAIMASSGPMNMIGMAFGLVDYPQEKMGFDGTRLTVSQTRPGFRTILGRFLMTNDVVFKEGIAGGTLSASWPLADLATRGAKLQYDGLKKVDNRQLHQARYVPQKKTDLRITLYFDPETFRHVRTQYYQVIEPTVGESKPGESAGQDQTRVQIVEEFSDFKAEGKLTLPHTYKLRLEIQGPGKSLMYDWALTLTSFEFGQTLEAKNFNMEVN